MERRPDESMNLLRTITEGAKEPEYATSTAPRRTPWVSFIGLLLVTVLLTYAVTQTFRNRDVAAAERDALLIELEDARSHQSDLGDRVTSMETEIRDLQVRTLSDPAEREALAEAELLSGAVAVTGEGIIVTAGDASGATSSEGRVLDSDLSILVNGLFEAGAEAIAINGRRVTTRTPIRSAGAAITVDYVSMSPPYTVEAIGDKQRLPGQFGATRAATWWQYLQLNYGLTLEITQSDEDLELPADPGLGLRYAKGT